MIIRCLIVLAVFVWKVYAEQGNEEECSPTVSYQATKAIEEYVFDWVRNQFSIRAPEDLPTECDLLPWKDVHHKHNALKDPDSGGRKWFKCKKCSKQFKTAEYLDKHIAARHLQDSTSSEHTSGTTCLARFCAFLPCDPPRPPLLATLHKHHPERVRLSHLCRETLSRCFPPSLSNEFKQAHHALEAHLCEGEKREMKYPIQGPSLSTVLSWVGVITIVGFYGYHYCFTESTHVTRQGLGVPKRAPPPPQVVEKIPQLVRRRTTGGTSSVDDFSNENGPV